jgi:AcrR family transcriptional regulator
MQERLNRQERKSQTRERLIDAAAVVFAQRGFETATLDEVAAAAGYTKGAVYSNFASKTELFIALIERRIEVQTAEHARRFEGQDLAGLARSLEVEPDEDPDSERQWLLLAVEFWLHAMRDERARVLMAEQYERARLASAELIAPLYQTLGQQPSMPPREMAIVIESIGIGLAIQAALDPGAVRMSLQGEVIARLLNLPALPDPVPAPPQAASDPSGQAGG